MKRKAAILMGLMILAGISMSSCISINGEGVVASDNYITRNYKVTEFQEIDASTVGNIHYTQSKDNQTSLEIYGPDNIVDLIQVAITDGKLLLKMKEKKINSVKGMKITISTPRLNALVLRGVGNIYIDKGLKTEDLKVGNYGVGNVKIKDLQCELIVVNSEGVGNVELSGEVTRAILKSKGIGNLKAERLKSKQVEAISEGVGNISCFASESISATSKGIGNIRYKGKPQKTTIVKSGIGSIKPI